MPEFQPRGREIQWPQPWPGIGLNWYDDSRERAPTSPAAEAAARADLLETLRDHPDTYWSRRAVELELNTKFGLRPISKARALLRSTPGASLIDAGHVWCATAVAPGWEDFVRTIYSAVPTDRLVTFSELQTATGADATSLHAAISTMCEDQWIVALQDSPTDGPFFCRSRGVNADYTDVYTKRMAARSR